MWIYKPPIATIPNIQGSILGIINQSIHNIEQLFLHKVSNSAKKVQVNKCFTYYSKAKSSIISNVNIFESRRSKKEKRNYY